MLKEQGDLLDQWIAVHEAEFGSDHDIPSANAVYLSKLKFGVINTDTCNPARLFSTMLQEKVEDSVQEKIMQDGGIPNNENIRVLTQDCHHHFRNVWIGAAVKKLLSYLNEILVSDLNTNDFRLQVCTLFDAVLHFWSRSSVYLATFPKNIAHGSNTG